MKPFWNKHHFVIVFSLSYFAIVEQVTCKGKNNGVLSQNSGHPVYQFATKLLDQVALEKGANTGSNILISPFSIRTALAIIYLGARGKTGTEIQNVLKLPSGRDELLQLLGRQISSTSNSDTSTFKIGNGLFLDKSFLVNETLATKLKSELGSTVQTLDFENDPAGSSLAINKWISSITQGHIENLVGSPSSSTPTFSFLLANALFYSGQWSKPFTLLPKRSDFLLNSGEKVKIPMMGLQSDFGYSYIPELKCIGISLPFKDDRFNFIILKPDDGQSVASVRPRLNDYPLEKLTSKLEESLRTVTLTLPKFTLKANYDTINIMRKMGITSLFDPASSDLSGLVKGSTKSASSTGRPVVSRMVHQTLLDINEYGATGAAGTALSGYPISVASSLDIDKPFLFLLNDRLTGPVLIGQLMNPLE